MAHTPTLPDVYTYEHRSVVLADRTHPQRHRARPVTDQEIERIYWDRDRLHPAYIRRHVETLRRAVRNSLPTLPGS